MLPIMFENINRKRIQFMISSYTLNLYCKLRAFVLNIVLFMNIFWFLTLELWSVDLSLFKQTLFSQSYYNLWLLTLAFWVRQGHSRLSYIITLFMHYVLYLHNDSYEYSLCTLFKNVKRPAISSIVESLVVIRYCFQNWIVLHITFEFRILIVCKHTPRPTNDSTAGLSFLYSAVVGTTNTRVMRRVGLYHPPDTSRSCRIE